VKTNRRKFLATLAIGAGAAGLGFDSFYWENNHLEVTAYDWPTQKFAKGASRVRLVQISDLHLKKFGGFEKQVAQRVNELKPELLVMTGDFIEDNDKFGELEEFLKLLPQACPKLAVLGNWDHWSGVKVKEFDRAFTELGIELLDNSREKLGSEYQHMCIIGVDDPTNGWDKLDKAAEHLSDRQFNLFLAHSPNIITRIRDLPIDLMLCGHTHGGQVRLPGVKPFWLPRKCEGYVAGFYEKNGKTMYVNRGLGNSVVPVRFRCLPEITVFTIKPAKQEPGVGNSGFGNRGSGFGSE